MTEDFDLKKAKRYTGWVFAILLFIPMSVALLSYWYFWTFWEPNQVFLFWLPLFVQQFGALEENVAHLVADGEVVKANAYVVTFLFGMIFIPISVFVTYNLNWLAITKTASELKEKMWQILLLYSAILFTFSYGIFYHKKLFAGGHRLAQMYEFGIAGLLFYTIQLGVLAFFYVLAGRVTKKILKEKPRNA